MLKRVLGVFAHPDDAEILAGGTLARAEEAHLLVLGGEMMTHEKLRVGEQEASCRLLDTKLYWGEFVHNEIPWANTSVSCIEQVVKAVQPDLVITHHPEEQHQDHFSVARATMCACRQHHRLWFVEPYPPSGGSYHQFAPQVYVDISPHLETKVEALHCHRSQVSRNSWFNWIDGIRARALARGAEVGVDAAECFQILRYRV